MKYKKLSKELTFELKKEMLYSEESRLCRECGCFQNIDGQIDGEHVNVCTLNAIGHLEVKPTGHCSYWRHNQTPLPFSFPQEPKK